MKLLGGLVAVGFLLLLLTGRTASEEAFKTKVLLQKDISRYAGKDMQLWAGEITLAPGATGSKHRHPGPTFVYVLAGDVEAEFEGTPLHTYHTGETIYEDPLQLHISTRNPSKTEAARILVFHLSANGEPLTQPET